MPSVGSLLISLKAETDSLRRDMDKGLGHVKAFGRDSQRIADATGGGFKRMGLTVEKFTGHLGRAGIGFALMSGAAESVGPAVDGLAKTFGAFLAGGPIAAGVTGIAELFAHLGKNTIYAGETAEWSQKKYDDLIEKSKAATKASAESMERLNDRERSIKLEKMGIKVAPGDIGTDRESASLMEQSIAARARADELRRGMADELAKEEAKPWSLRRLPGMSLKKEIEAKIKKLDEWAEQLAKEGRSSAETLDRRQQLDALELGPLKTGVTTTPGHGANVIPSRTHDFVERSPGSGVWERMTKNIEDQTKALEAIEKNTRYLNRPARLGP